jgi:hypothetical protein
MDLRLYTWNGIAINDGTTYKGSFPPGQKFNLSANAVIVPRAGEVPFLSATQQGASVLVIEIYLAGGANINTNRELLKKYFNPLDHTRHNLIARDAADGNKEWYVTGYPVRLVNVGGDENAFSIALAIETPYWKLVTAGDTTWSVTASGQTQAVTNVGNIATPPKFTLTPTVAKTGGFQYRRWVSIYNNLDISVDTPLDITNGGLDTATLTTAKMQADGDDFRVRIDGVEVDRWLHLMDSAATKCWANYSLGPRREGTTNTTIANTGAVATISLTNTRATKAFLQAAARASNKVVLIDSEAFTYTGVNTVTAQLTGVTRQRKGTSAATHATPKTVRLIEHDTWILYGDSTLSAPDVDDDNKPLFDLDSTNAAWNWTNYYSRTATRPGGWKGEKIQSKTDLSYLYTGDSNTLADPSTELGLAVIGTPADYDILSEVAVLAWVFTHPAGITDVTYSGSKYYTSSWTAVAGLQSLQEGAAWFTEDNVSAPSVAYTWEDFGPTAVELSSTPKTIRFAMDGALAPLSDEAALIQFDTVIAEFSTASLPTISLGAEAAAYFFDVTITNNTTGEYIKVAVPCALNETVTIDCENKEAYLSDGSRVNVTLSTDRPEWLTLASGANEILYTDVGTNAVTVHIIHRDRTL